MYYVVERPLRVKMFITLNTTSGKLRRKQNNKTLLVMITIDEESRED